MWTWLLSLLTSSLGSVTKELKEAYQSKLNAQNDKERIAADERIAILEARKSTILAAQPDPWERFIRILLALPVVVYINKLFIWDKVLGLGSTDGLSNDLTQFMWIVVGGYFIDTTIRGTARILKK